MADSRDFTLKRNNGNSIDILYPTTRWAQVEEKPTTFTPTAHSHGNITNGGAIGSTPNLMIKTGTDGKLTTLPGGLTSQFLRGDGTWATPADATTLTSLGITATAAELNYTDGVTSNIQTQLNNKVDKVTGKGLSTNDYTTTEKNKLAGLSATHSHSTSQITDFDSAVLALSPDGARPASDVKSWAKADNKPTYAAADVGALANTHPAKDVTTLGIGNWNNAANWGNHATQGYLKETSLSTILTGGVSSILSSNLTQNRALISNGSGKVAVSTVTSTQLGFLDATSSIQTQLNGKAASSHGHTWTEITNKPALLRQVSFTGGTLIVEMI